MRFDHRKVSGGLAEVRSVGFYHCKACGKLAELWREQFDHRNACDLHSLGECVFDQVVKTHSSHLC